MARTGLNEKFIYECAGWKMRACATRPRHRYLSLARSLAVCVRERRARAHRSMGARTHTRTHRLTRARASVRVHRAPGNYMQFRCVPACARVAHIARVRARVTNECIFDHLQLWRSARARRACDCTHMGIRIKTSRTHWRALAYSRTHAYPAARRTAVIHIVRGECD